MTRGAVVRGDAPDKLVSSVDARWFGITAFELTHEAPHSPVANQLSYRYEEPSVEIAEPGGPRDFDNVGDV